MLVENKSGKYAIIEVEDGYINMKLTSPQTLDCG